MLKFIADNRHHYSNMGDTDNSIIVDESTSQSTQPPCLDNTAALMKSDFIELRKLCNDAVAGLGKHVSQPFEMMTAQIVSKKQSVTKIFLFEQLQKLIKHCTRMCDRDSKTCNPELSATHDEHQYNLVSDYFAKYIAQAEASLKSHSEQLSCITTQLHELQSCIDNPKSMPIVSVKQDYEPHQQGASNAHSPLSIATPSEMKCYDSYDTGFLDQDLYRELETFLTSENSFVDENGHAVLAFGERYSYSGGKAPNNDPLPDCLSTIIDKINSKFDCNVNSVLVNRYSGPDSYLPEHSDDESSIDPDSSIYTLSVGQTRTVVFTDKFSKIQTLLPVEDNSLYSMSRDSQNCFVHKIEKESTDGLRYSLTFRAVGNLFRRSTIIVGDSNSKNFAFGEGKGTFGKGLPGKRVKASDVRSISPLDCLSYANVVIQCGVNDIRDSHVGGHKTSTNINVDNTFKELKGKIDLICQLKKNINVFICPILPTRSSVLNARAVRFNNLIYSQIIDQNYYRCNMINVSSLCDATYRTNLLDPAYSRGDMVHLNRRGTGRLASIIKDVIFLKYNSGKGGRINSRKPYSAALHDGPPGTTS